MTKLRSGAVRRGLPEIKRDTITAPAGAWLEQANPIVLRLGIEAISASNSLPLGRAQGKQPFSEKCHPKPISGSDGLRLIQGQTSRRGDRRQVTALRGGGDVSVLDTEYKREW
jgi:hypothetical protein